MLVQWCYKHGLDCLFVGEKRGLCGGGGARTDVAPELELGDGLLAGLAELDVVVWRRTNKTNNSLTATAGALSQPAANHPTTHPLKELHRRGQRVEAAGGTARSSSRERELKRSRRQRVKGGVEAVVVHIVPPPTYSPTAVRIQITMIQPVGTGQPVRYSLCKGWWASACCWLWDGCEGEPITRTEVDHLHAVSTAAHLFLGQVPGARRCALPRVARQNELGLRAGREIVRAVAAPSRRRDCHFAGIPSPSILKLLLKVEGGAAE